MEDRCSTQRSLATGFLRHGIRLIGDDESNPTWVPKFSTIEDNDLSGSIVGCIDDFEPGQNQPGMNTWTGNNCAGTLNSPPVYLWRLCPNSVSNPTVAGWEMGVAEPSAVQARISEFDANRKDGGEFSPGNLFRPAPWWPPTSIPRGPAPPPGRTTLYVLWSAAEAGEYCRC